jgi:hypothetical protein
MVYLTTLSVEDRMFTKWRTRKDAPGSDHGLISSANRHLPRDNLETHENLDSRFSGRDVKPKPPELVPRVVPTGPGSSVARCMSSVTSWWHLNGSGTTRMQFGGRFVERYGIKCCVRAKVQGCRWVKMSRVIASNSAPSQIRAACLKQKPVHLAHL